MRSAVVDAAADGDELRKDADGDLGRRDGADVEADGGVHAIEALDRHPFFHERGGMRATLARLPISPRYFRSRAASARIASRSCVCPRVTTTT